MLTLRQRLFLIIGILAGIVAIVVIAILFFQREKTPVQPPSLAEETETQPAVPTTDAVQRGVVPVERVITEPNQAVQAEMQNGEFFVRQLAKTFVERFGSYSNQNDNRHIDDVLPLVTAQMISWLESQRQEQSPEYIGVTTRVISSNVVAYTEGEATVEISTQESVVNGESRVSYRDGRVELVKQSDEWKIAGLYWNTEG